MVDDSQKLSMNQHPSRRDMVAERRRRTRKRVERRELLELDLDKSWGYMKQLTDIRFKLLTIVPAVTGIAVSLLGGVNARGAESSANPRAIVVGVIGLVATVGVIIYELRNSDIYERVCRRIAFLEEELEFLTIRTDRSDNRGGIVNDRSVYYFPEHAPAGVYSPEHAPAGVDPKKFARFLGLHVKHDRGLAMIYGASVGGWAFAIIAGVQSSFPALGFYADTIATHPLFYISFAALLAWGLGLLVSRRITALDAERANLAEKIAKVPSKRRSPPAESSAKGPEIH